MNERWVVKVRMIDSLINPDYLRWLVAQAECEALEDSIQQSEGLEAMINAIQKAKG